jgi:stress response protein YsnF
LTLGDATTVDVQKQARVAKEIVVGKEAAERTEQGSDTVRRAEVYVDEDASLLDETQGGDTRF